MNQANVERLVSKLRFNVGPRRRLRNIDGPEGRLRKIQKTLTALIKYERLELNYGRADETRGYVERLISEAIRHGPEHKETMDMANFYILEKQYIHKLFKVLAPKYKDYHTSYTKLHVAPNRYPIMNNLAILELRGNIYPPIDTPTFRASQMIHNILLSSAKKAFNLDDHTNMTERLAKQSLEEPGAEREARTGTEPGVGAQEKAGAHTRTEANKK